MKTAFLGAVRFSGHCLDLLCRLGHPPSIVYGLAPAQRRRHSDYGDVAAEAGLMGLPSKRIIHARDMDLAGVDLLWVLGWSEILPRETLGVPRLGCIGSHPSLLPHGRGRHPIIHAILEAWPSTGLTFFWLDEGVDTGDIAAQVAIALRHDEDAGTLYMKVERAADGLLRQLVPRIVSGDFPRTPQPAGDFPILARRHPGEERIDWTQPAEKIIRHIRALTCPYLGARARLNGRDIIVWSADQGPPGPWDLTFPTGDGKKVHCIEWQFV